MKKNFLLGLDFKMLKCIFCQSKSCVLTMSSWSWRVTIRGLNMLKSSIEVHYPAVSGNLKEMLFLLVWEFRELLLRFDGELCRTMAALWPSVTFLVFESDHFSFGGSKVWPSRLLQATVCCKHVTWTRCNMTYTVHYFTHPWHSTLAMN